MRLEPFVVAAAIAAALGTSVTALAESNADRLVIPGGIIQVQPTTTFDGASYHGGYVSEQDGALLDDALAELSVDRAMNGSIVTMVASNGELIVNGSTTDVAQASRMEMKLKALHGGTRVVAWFDSFAGGE